MPKIVCVRKVSLPRNEFPAEILSKKGNYYVVKYCGRIERFNATTMEDTKRKFGFKNILELKRKREM